MNWFELKAIALYDLHLSEAEFWDLEPIELAYLFDRWEAAEMRLDSRAAVNACITANVFKGKDAKALEPGDLFPSLRSVESDGVLNGAPVIQAPDRQLAVLKTIFGDNVRYREEV